MKPTQQLHDLGQSLWLDNITRDLLDDGTLKRYIDELSIQGLTSNPTIFDHAITHGETYDSEIRRLQENGLSGEDLFFEPRSPTLTRAADLFTQIHRRTTVWMDLSPSRCHLYWPMTPRKQRAKLRNCIRRPTVRIYLLKFRAPRRDVLRSKRPSIREYRSTSPCFSTAISTWLARMLTCADWSGGLPKILAPMSAPSPLCSSAAGTRRQWKKFQAPCATNWELRSPADV